MYLPSNPLHGVQVQDMEVIHPTALKSTPEQIPSVADDSSGMRSSWARLIVLMAKVNIEKDDF